MTEQIPTNTLMVLIPAIFSAFAGAVAWLDARAKKIREEIEAEAARDKAELRAEIQQLREELHTLRGAHNQARTIAVEGISESSDPKSKDRFVKIAQVLG